MADQVKITPELIQQFVERWLPVARSMQLKYGINPNALLAQMAHETNFGTSVMANSKNNMGGLGAYTMNPDAALSFATPEDAVDYQARIQMAKPKFPDSPAGRQAIHHYGATAPILEDPDNSLESVFAAMQDSPYATDKPGGSGATAPYYAKKLMIRLNQMEPHLNMGKITPLSQIQPGPVAGPPTPQRPVAAARPQKTGGDVLGAFTRMMFPPVPSTPPMQKGQNVSDFPGYRTSTSLKGTESPAFDWVIDKVKGFMGGKS